MGPVEFGLRTGKTRSTPRVKVFVIAVAFLLVLTASCQVNHSGSVLPSVTAEPTLPHAMKGYELYSWQVDGEWYFSLLEGTNRLKTLQEVTADKVAVKRIESILQELGRLPKGEQVIWTRRNISNLTLPPEVSISQIKESCARSGIDLTIAR